MNNKQWSVCIKELPEIDGDYYIYVSNIQTGCEIRKTSFRNKRWTSNLNDEEVIIAWKKIPEKEIKDKLNWLEIHRSEIKQLFKIDTMNINEFEVVENLVECILEYSNWFHYNQVHTLDGKYVIRIMF